MCNNVTANHEIIFADHINGSNLQPWRAVVKNNETSFSASLNIRKDVEKTALA